MKFKSLATFSFLQIHQCVNAAFEDYMISIKQSPSEFRQRMIRDGVNKGLSVGMFEENKLVGLTLMGIDEWNGKWTAYDAATGIVPQARGNSGTRKMFENLLPRLLKQGIEQCLLEVIIGNDVALHVYKSIGFRIQRTLHCYRGNVSNTSPQNGEYAFAQWPNPSLQALVQWADCQPAWGASPRAIFRTFGDYEWLGMKFQGDWVALAVWIPASGRIVNISVDPQYRRRGMGTALLAEMQRRCAVSLVIINVDDSHLPINLFFEAMGMSRFLSQYEMKLDLIGSGDQ
ncbi:GNAT family N-acetyltransferase [Pontibacter sp. G13]|uniref:GNAT family N-acetyltransferase n=1 Tax=Pontibacter sp. G13 TaxID=3074898 RepID=UPI00288AC239|nr:GNAT family N-acetyltransferase [Pontibacter sp. G13]WNJ21443.1 GNAT family N-acetyltransferase [Pontibacter sp. G13]